MYSTSTTIGKILPQKNVMITSMGYGV